MLLTTYDQSAQFPYYQIYIDEGDLVCAPFGLKNMRDPVLRFTDFKQVNADIFGWWHISCSYEF